PTWPDYKTHHHVFLRQTLAKWAPFLTHHCAVDLAAHDQKVAQPILALPHFAANPKREKQRCRYYYRARFPSRAAPWLHSLPRPRYASFRSAEHTAELQARFDLVFS